MASRNPKIKKLEEELSLVKAQCNRLHREREDLKEMADALSGENKALIMQAERLKFENTKEVECLKDQVNWLRSLIENMSISVEKLDLFNKEGHSDDKCGEPRCNRCYPTLGGVDRSYWKP